MDPKAYENARQYIREIIRMDSDDTSGLPPPDVNVREWIHQMVEANRPQIEQRRKLAVEPRTWSAEEQDALANIAESNEEPPWDRQIAMDAIAVCQIARHADMLAGLLADPHSDLPIRHKAAYSLGLLGLKRMLPALHKVAMSTEVPAERYIGSLYDACVQAMFSIASRNKIIDPQKYRTRPENNLNLMCKRWWDEMQPTEEMIFAWSRGEHPS